MEKGKNYLFFTGNFIYVGCVVDETPFQITIEPAATVFNTGRLANCFKDGLEALPNSEVEPHTGKCFIPRGSCVASEYNHPVPTKQK